MKYTVLVSFVKVVEVEVDATNSTEAQLKAVDILKNESGESRIESIVDTTVIEEN